MHLPNDLNEMMMVFKPCVSTKIFVHELFPDDEAGIILDTDIVIMDDIVKLWNIIYKFDNDQFAGIAPVETHYSNVLLPYYGPVGVGLNAGVLLFNLTRMRDMVGGGFTEAIRFTWRKYKKQLRLMEQDVLNVIFEKSPK